MEQSSSQSNIKERCKIKKPRMYKVIFHNDNFTTFDMVVLLLVSIFSKTNEEAERLTIKVHREGRATVGVYTLDVAATKTEKAIKMAREQNFPLRITYEPE